MLLLYFILILGLQANQPKLTSPHLRKYIESEANIWYLDNKALIYSHPEEALELKKILELSKERAVAIIECQQESLKSTDTAKDMWEQLKSHRLNPAELENSDLPAFENNQNWCQALNNFNYVSSQYAYAINNHNLKFLNDTLEQARMTSREIIVKALKLSLQKRSLGDTIKDKIPLIKELVSEFGAYLWQKMPRVSVQSFKILDDEFQEASSYAWRSVILLEKQSCQMWDAIENSRADFYDCCLKLAFSAHS